MKNQYLTKLTLFAISFFALSLTLFGQTPRPTPTPTLEVCCPPLTKEHIASQLVYQGTTINAPYKLAFNPTTQFTGLMSSYAQTLFYSHEISKINMVWELLDANGNSLEKNWLGWSGANTSLPIGNTIFFNTQLQVNQQYKIHIWMNMTDKNGKEVWFSGKGCSDYDIFVKVEVQKNVKDPKTNLIFTDAQGKRIEPRPRLVIKK